VTTEIEDTRKRLSDQMMDEGILRFWTHDVDSLNHSGLPWAYTVGRTMYGRPELLVTGLGEAASHELLTELEGRNVHPDFPLATSVGRVAFILAETGVLHAAYAVFGPNYSALQAIWEGDAPQPLHPAGGLIMTDPYGDGGLPEVPC
jgi:hypothetical protein